MKRFLAALTTISAAVNTYAASLPGTATKTDVCIHYITDTYYSIPMNPIIYANLTAQRWTYLYVCPAKVNFTFCYQTPTSYPNGNTYECQSNVQLDANGNYDPVNTVPVKQNDPLLSAAIVIKPKATKKYYRTCPASDAVCSKALFNMNKCMFGSESCVIAAGGKAISP